ncbi:MAG: cytochrome b [Gammaproteobacteria bacterium]
MNWRNSIEGYGLISILLHWLVAVAVVALFALGLWMVELTYYHPWYRDAPHIHKSVGLLLFGVMLLRLVWRYANPRPRLLASTLEARVAVSAHLLMYALSFAVLVSGYLISTADGRAIEVFDFFSVPATLSGYPQQEDTAGLIHELLAYALLGLSSLHAMASLKHHFIDRDATLTRILRPYAATTNTLPREEKQ